MGRSRPKGRAELLACVIDAVLEGESGWSPLVDARAKLGLSKLKFTRLHADVHRSGALTAARAARRGVSPVCGSCHAVTAQADGVCLLCRDAEGREEA